MKKGIVIISVVLATLFVVGCGSAPSAPAIYDSSVPLEQSSTIAFTGRIIEFDGQSTVLSSQWNAGLGVKQIIIPAGRHTLEFYSEAVSGNTLYQTGNTVTYEFLPGHTYAAGAQKSGNTFIPVIFDTANIREPDTTIANASPFEGIWESSDKKHQIVFAGDEFIQSSNGVGQRRGTFTYNSSTSTISFLILGVYRNKDFPWVVFAIRNVYPDTYDGTILNWLGVKYRRAE